MTDAPSADDILARLNAADGDALVWLPVNGRTFSPLLRPGDQIGVARCAVDDLQRGDLALVRRDGAWAVRVVAATLPLRVGTPRGRVDDAPGEVHGRVAAIRRGGRTLGFGAGWRAAAWAMQRAAAAARMVLGPAARLARTSAAGRRIRGRRVGPVHVRPVRPEDADALDAFCAGNLPRMRPYIVTQARTRWATAGAAVAAFDARGGVRGFVFVDEYRAEGTDLPGVWLRALAVDPSARRLGLGRELVREVIAEAHRRGAREIFVDVLETNRASIALMRGAGFIDSPPELVAEANRVLAASGEGPRVILRIARE
ncbi:GNAT family N-acetyltransferase [Longimicrobium sp.]|uniref:GNAT family N-acetyltransferase n=1 Tax=Longimicrobium sp. TaxID=2029185 RepID=UPI002B7BD468|nr:GNAT family N-acetyltransferase [Longimicrobium sp.]HSU15884.1 GNAT family N-acetyltransferase [Longimicrobium sp.]